MFAPKGPALRAALILFLAVSGVCSAENNLHRSVLNNHDVVTLAKAGFDENFLVNLIVNSQTRFDTSPDALAALAEQGLTQRIVEVMMNPVAAGTPAGAPVPATIAAAKPVRPSKVSPVRLAIMQNAAYHESKSVLFGAWKTEAAVGASRSQEPSSSRQKTSRYDVAK